MTAWDNRFAQPDPRKLVAEIGETCQASFKTVQGRLEAIEGATSEVRWLGVPWRWTFAYRCDGEELAFLVPDTRLPLLALPVPLARLEQADLKRLSRPVREGLARARIVGEIAWAEWELTSVSLATELARLVARQLREAAEA